MLEKALTIVEREITNIFSLSEKKLAPNYSKDLVAYVKLLSEASDAQKDQAKALKKLSTEELKILAKELLATRY